MKYCITSILFLSLYFLLLQNNYSQKIHAIIVADIDDPEIGKSCEIDQNQMVTEISTIAASINYSLQIKTITRGNVVFEEIDNTCRNLTVQNQDIIFFYYSGHGYNESSNSEYPSLKLKNGSYPLEKINDQLKSKGAKLVITFGDCCNVISDKIENLQKGYKPLATDINIPDNYKNLFLEPNGNILVSSSKKGQYAYGNNLAGGIYTNEFIIALHCAINYIKSPSWDQLLKDSENRISRYDFGKGKQIPQFKIDIKTDQHISFLSYSNINKYLNDLIDSSILKEKRRELIKSYGKFFIPKAKVNIYDSTLQIKVEVLPIENFIEVIYLNTDKISMINLIENKSLLNENGDKYKEISVHRVWKK